MFRITDQDIDRVQPVLLPDGRSFDDETRTVIKCLESKDVLACPGSGKTTALLSKLLIISPQLPIEGNRGICVLTHTNVAIDAIKDRVGFGCERLFSYPNHFGTIQSFVDKFLAIPAYAHFFGRRPMAINNDLHDEKVDNLFKYLSKEAKHWCYRNEAKGFPHAIRFHLTESRLVEEINGRELRLNVADRREKKIYDSLLKMKKTIMQEGVLSFDDAYCLAHRYIALHPQLGVTFSMRFPFVFIDEMQDTDVHQIELLRSLFDSERVVLQRIGDINQSIYNSARHDVVWDLREPPLEITGSKRFSNSIARAIRSVCVEPQALEGNAAIREIPPILILFTDDHTRGVIPRFGELIIENRLHLERKKIFKAIGWIAKPHEKHRTIPEYWPRYSREVRLRKEHFSNLWNYLVPQPNDIIQHEGANVYRRSIIRALLRVLSIVGINHRDRLPFNERSMLKHIEDVDPTFYRLLNLHTARWCLQIQRREDIWNEVRQFIIDDFRTFFRIVDLSGANDFLSGRTEEPQTEVSFQESNTYLHSPEVKIDVSTVHGVKGETHTATLYLETFYYGYDVHRIIEYLKGHHSPPQGSRLIETLRVAYVGMSRPSHLLCVAVHAQHVFGHDAVLREAGWQIDNHLVSH